MRQVRYRAVIALDPAPPVPASTWHSARSHGQARHRHHSEDGEYPNHTRELMLRTESPEHPGRYRSFATELCWDDDAPLHPGDRHVVTLTVTDDEAPASLGPGQHFTLWNGAEVGHGTISRQMYSFTEYGPF